MAGSIPRIFIDDLLIRTDIVDLIDKYVPLKKSGANFVARCPFHSEKTPSFSVNRNKQFYHCFGCGASGDAISFLMAYNHLDFTEAVEDLASGLGIEVPRELRAFAKDPEKQQRLEQIFTLLNQAASEYQAQLRLPAGEKALQYLQARSVNENIAKRYMLGYAPDGWRFMVSRHDRALLLAGGLAVDKEGGRLYDRFRNRIMYPIRDKRGRVVGFGGRVLDDSVPKYLNSPETPVFQKSTQIYGLYELLQCNSKPERILVTEGYMDVIALAGAGLDNAVACLGTAISQDHVALLFRFTRDLVFCFDGDSAGREAAWRAVEASLPNLKEGRQIRIMLLPEGMDPDSLVAEEGVAAFAHRIESAKTMSDYFFERLSADLSLKTIEGRAALLSLAQPYLQRLPGGSFQVLMNERLKLLTKSDSLAVPKNTAKLNTVVNKWQGRGKSKISPIRTVIALLLQNPELIEFFKDCESDCRGVELPGIALLNEIVERIEGTPEINMAALIAGFRGTEYEAHVLKLAHWQFLIPFEGLQEEFKGALIRLMDQVREKCLADLIAKQEQQGLDDGERKLLLKMLKKQ